MQRKSKVSMTFRSTGMFYCSKNGHNLMMLACFQYQMVGRVAEIDRALLYRFYILGLCHRLSVHSQGHSYLAYFCWIMLVDITSDCRTVETQICRILFEHHFRRIIQQIYSFHIMHSIRFLGYADTNTLDCRFLSAFYQIE